MIMVSIGFQSETPFSTIFEKVFSVSKKFQKLSEIRRELRYPCLYRR